MHLNRLVGKVSFSILETVKRLFLVLGDTTICFYGCLEVIFFMRPIDTISFKFLS